MTTVEQRPGMVVYNLSSRITSLEGDATGIAYVRVNLRCKVKEVRGSVDTTSGTSVFTVKRIRDGATATIGSVTMPAAKKDYAADSLSNVDLLDGDYLRLDADAGPGLNTTMGVAVIVMQEKD